MSKGSGLSRSERRRNARKERLRALVPRGGAVIGIDLGEDKQALAVVDHDVRVLWRKTARVKAHELGEALGLAVAAARAAGFTAVTVACEPTGPRWMQVQRLCAQRGLVLVCVQPLASHIAREQQDYTAHKRDESDAVLIARLACELHCYVPEELDEAWALLRQLGRRREQLVKAATAAAARVRDFLSVAWPSAETAAAGPFESVTWLACLEVVTGRCGGDPARLAGLGEEEFFALVTGCGRDWGASRAVRRITRNMLGVLEDPDAVGWSRRGLFRRIAGELGDLRRAPRPAGGRGGGDARRAGRRAGPFPARGRPRADAHRGGRDPGRGRRPAPVRDLEVAGQARRACPRPTPPPARSRAPRASPAAAGRDCGPRPGARSPRCCCTTRSWPRSTRPWSAPPKTPPGQPPRRPGRDPRRPPRPAAPSGRRERRPGSRAPPRCCAGSAS